MVISPNFKAACSAWREGKDSVTEGLLVDLVCVYVWPSVCAAAEAPAGRLFTGKTTLIRGGVCSSQGCSRGESWQHTHMKNHRYLFSPKLCKEKSRQIFMPQCLFTKYLGPAGNCSFLPSIRSASPCKLRLHNWSIFSRRVQHQHNWHLKRGCVVMMSALTSLLFLPEMLIGR